MKYVRTRGMTLAQAMEAQNAIIAAQTGMGEFIKCKGILIGARDKAWRYETTHLQRARVEVDELIKELSKR